MQTRKIFAVLLGVVAVSLAVWELIANYPPMFHGTEAFRDFSISAVLEQARTAPDDGITPHAGWAAIENGTSLLSVSAIDLAPERRAEYFFIVRLFLVLLAAFLVLLALIFGLWSRGRAVPLTRLRYEKLLLFGFLLPLVVGGVIIYFNLVGATDYGLWYNWSRFAVNLTLLSCAMLYITIAMTRKYVNRYCHRTQLAVPPFQRWPGLLNVGTLAILLVASLTPPSWREFHLVALGWVVLTALIYLGREIKYLWHLARYVSYYRLAAGTAYLTLCVSALGVMVIGVPVWWAAEKREMTRDSVVFTAEASLAETAAD